MQNRYITIHIYKIYVKYIIDAAEADPL